MEGSCFASRLVEETRRIELVELLKQFWTSVFSVFFLYISPRVITIAVFGTYIYYDPEEFTSAKAFTVMTTFLVLQVSPGWTHLV